MAGHRAGLRASRSWWFDVAVCVTGVLVLGWSGVVALRSGPEFLVAALVAVPLIVVVARFPMVLDNGDGSIEVGFDSSILMFLLCTLDASAALVVWSLGVLATQLTSGKRISAKVFNIGIGILSGGLSTVVLHAIRGSVTGTPRELGAVAVAAAAYFTTDYVLSAVSVAIDSATPIGQHLNQRGTVLAIGCFVPFDLLGYLGAVLVRSQPWWTLSLLAVPLATLLVATRAVTRGGENARRLRVLFGAAVRAQTLYDASQIVESLQTDARELVRLQTVELRPVPPRSHEIGAQVQRGKDASWIVAPARQRARSTMAADQQGLEVLAAISSDAFSRLQLTNDMVHFARHDPLTDLPNRGILLDRVAHALQLARRRATVVALMFIDLDGFKPVNDRFGHAAGDAVLIEVAHRVSSCVRSSDTVARLGGDEFAVLLEDVDPAEVRRVCQRVLDSLSSEVSVNGTKLPLGASIGLAYGDGLGSAESLLRDADMAMYEAKGRGKAQFVEYDPVIGQARLERLELVEELRHALTARDIDVVYQPVVASETGRIVGVEALARWRVGQRDIPPNVFIPLAEETGLIVTLGEVVLAKAAADAAALRGAAGGRITISVNISAGQLREPGFVETVRAALATMGDTGLVLEITERQGIGDDPVAIAAMTTISQMGVKFAIDDFGVGFSSISYLQDVPADIIKADAALSQNIDRDERACALLRSITMMGDALGLEVVVEGIERASQLALVRDDVHAAYAQGYLMHRPMGLDQLLTVVHDNRTGVASGAGVDLDAELRAVQGDGSLAPSA